MNPIARLSGGLAALAPPLAMAFALAACTSTAPTTTYGAAPTAAAPTPRPALAALQTRDRIVRMYGDHGALFVSVRDDEGHVVAEGVPLEDLRALDPFLYEACTSAVAHGGGTYLDARLYVDDVRASSSK